MHCLSPHSHPSDVAMIGIRCGRKNSTKKVHSIPPAAGICLIDEAGLRACESLTSISPSHAVNDAQWLNEIVSRLPLRGQRQILTGFPFHPDCINTTRAPDLRRGHHRLWMLPGQLIVIRGAELGLKIVLGMFNGASRASSSNRVGASSSGFLMH